MDYSNFSGKIKIIRIKTKDLEKMFLTDEEYLILDASKDFKKYIGKNIKDIIKVYKQKKKFEAIQEF